MSETAKGVLAVLGAAVIWGVSPVFYKFLSHVPALDVLAHRILWSLVFFTGLLAFQGRLREVPAAFADRRSTLLLIAAALIISVNWALFIWAVQTGKTLQSSLGYYIYPLISVLLGTLLFREQLALLQWCAIALVTFAVSLLTIGVGALPWVALVLATSFAFYGVLKRQMSMGPVTSVTVEVMLASPLALGLLIFGVSAGHDLTGGDPLSFAVLVLAGPMTAVPLILFSYGARRLKMASVGLMLYLNPTMQFGLAIFLFGEAFSSLHFVAFVLIWVALGIYSATAWSAEKARRSAARHVAASGTAL